MATMLPGRRTRRPRFAAGLLIAVALGVASCSQTDGPGSSATSEAPAHEGEERSAEGAPDGVRVLDPEEDLYALAEDLDPGEPGEPIAVQPVTTFLDATVWRVLHHSRSLEGDDIAVSGIIAVPHGPAPDGGRPVASWAHGTTGLADDCAPSRTLAQLEAAVPLLDRGMVVAATDYEGLGTPGLHPYLVGESQGRGALDVVRAARALGPMVGASDEVIVWGHSQGGHAALFANQIAPEWAPELDVLGAVAGAPPSQMPLLMAALGRGDPSVFFPMIASGWAAAHPEADLADLFTATGLERLAVLEEGCTDVFAEAWLAPSEEPLLRPEAADPPDPWPGLVEANDPGRSVGAGPVLLLHGVQDVLIPEATSSLLATRLCSVGQAVRYLAYPDADHVSVVAEAMPEMLEWIDARLQGHPAPDDCEGQFGDN